MPQTERFDLPYPLLDGTSPNDPPGDIKALADAVEAGLAGIDDGMVRSPGLSPPGALRVASSLVSVLTDGLGHGRHDFPSPLFGGAPVSLVLTGRDFNAYLLTWPGAPNGFTNASFWFGGGPANTPVQVTYVAVGY